MSKGLGSHSDFQVAEATIIICVDEEIGVGELDAIVGRFPSDVGNERAF